MSSSRSGSRRHAGGGAGTSSVRNTSRERCVCNRSFDHLGPFRLPYRPGRSAARCAPRDAGPGPQSGLLGRLSKQAPPPGERTTGGWAPGVQASPVFRDHRRFAGPRSALVSGGERCRCPPRVAGTMPTGRSPVATVRGARPDRCGPDDPGRGLGGYGGSTSKLAVMIASNSARSHAGSAYTSSANPLVTASRWVVSGIIDHSPATSSRSTPGHVPLINFYSAHCKLCQVSALDNLKRPGASVTTRQGGARG